MSVSISNGRTAAALEPGGDSAPRAAAKLPSSREVLPRQRRADLLITRVHVHLLEIIQADQLTQDCDQLDLAQLRDLDVGRNRGQVSAAPPCTCVVAAATRACRRGARSTLADGEVHRVQEQRLRFGAARAPFPEPVESDAIVRGYRRERRMCDDRPSLSIRFTALPVRNPTRHAASVGARGVDVARLLHAPDRR